MTANEINAQWDALTDAVDKLRRNRQNVPLDLLRTKYAAAYKALVGRITGLMGQWLWHCVDQVPWPLQADADIQEFEDRCAELLLSEASSPDGLYSKMEIALTEKMDPEAFSDLVRQFYEKVYANAFQPIWDKHCSWIGPPANRWIQNDLTGWAWSKRKKSWVDRNGKAMDNCWPPSETIPDLDHGKEKTA